MQLALFAGLAKPWRDGQISAIDKQPLQHAVWCGLGGFAGDECADLRNHGGSDRALHYYPVQHYQWWPIWQQGMNLPAPCRPWQAGAFGENISADGLSEAQACIGDIYRLGNAVIQISQPRSPCFKLNLQFGYPQLSQVMQLNGRTGWLLRVLEEGEVSPDATLRLLDKPHPELTVKRTADILFNQVRHEEDLTLLAENPALSDKWRQYANNWLSQETVTDWSKRLLGGARPSPQANG